MEREDLIHTLLSMVQDIYDVNVDLANAEPYYPLPDKLQELRNLMDVDGSERFRSYIEEYSLQPIDEYILMAKTPIPEHIKGIQDYKLHTVNQLKQVAKSAVRAFKQASESFG